MNIKNISLVLLGALMGGGLVASLLYY